MNFQKNHIFLLIKNIRKTNKEVKNWKK